MTHTPALTVWLTGLSSAGKTTLAHELARELRAGGHPVEVLDGDDIRCSLSSDLGFSRRDRDEQVRRVAFVAALLTRNGIITIVSAISPYREARNAVRALIPGFVEVFVNAPLATCEWRDVKGLYRRARAGELTSFTGIDDPYEPPLAPDVECLTAQETIAESAAKVLAVIRARLFL